MAYSPIFNPAYNAWHDLPTEDTPVTAAVMTNYDTAIENIESFLDGSTAIKPVEKTGLMTQSVGVDANGALFTSPLGNIESVNSNIVVYDNTESGMTATNVQAAIDELAGSSGGSTAETTTYDNTSSGMTATNVQDAIDELADGAGSPVNPTAKTVAMTQAVGVDANGLLWTAPGGGGGGGSVETASTIFDTVTRAQTNTTMTVSQTIQNFTKIRIKGYSVYNSKNLITFNDYHVSDITFGDTTYCYWFFIDSSNLGYFTVSQDGTTITWVSVAGTVYISEIQGISYANETAENVDYDNTSSGLVADDVQTAIDEIDTTIDNPDAVTTLADSDFIYLNIGGEMKKITLANLKTVLGI